MANLKLTDPKNPLYDIGAGHEGNRLMRADAYDLTWVADTGELALLAHDRPIRTMEFLGIEYIHTRDNAGHLLHKTPVGRGQHHYTSHSR